MTVMLLIKHLRLIDECFESYCKFPLQVFLGFIPTFGLDLWFLALVDFGVMLQYRFPTPNLSLVWRKMAALLFPLSACGHQSYLDCSALA